MIGIFFGTRPEYIKITPIILAFKKYLMDFKLIYVKQHKELLSIEDIKYDLFIDITNLNDNRLNSITTSILMTNSNIFEQLSYVLIQGDTTTAFSIALNAFHRGIPIVHVEAGLRTYKATPFPEEINRRLITQLATIHYCPTKKEYENLTKELPDESWKNISIVGNTSIDVIKPYKTYDSSNTVLITLHRGENLNNITPWINSIIELANNYKEYKFVWPLHPNPKIQKYKKLLENSSVYVTEPLPHNELATILSKCYRVITDSGGIQEECSYLEKYNFVCRNSTERENPYSIVCKNQDELALNFRKYISADKIANYCCPFGNGNTGEKIAKDIRRRLQQI